MREGLMDDSGYKFFEPDECSHYESCTKDAYERGQQDAVEKLFPFIEHAQEGICDDVMEMTVDENGDTWCTEHCNNFCEECVKKWLELKKEKE